MSTNDEYNHKIYMSKYMKDLYKKKKAGYDKLGIPLKWGRPALPVFIDEKILEIKKKNNNIGLYGIAKKLLADYKIDVSISKISRVLHKYNSKKGSFNSSIISFLAILGFIFLIFIVVIIIIYYTGTHNITLTAK